jgi:acyl carrier protein
MITADDIRVLIQENVMGVDAMALGEDDNFKQAGIDSLDQINVLLAIEEKHGYKIPDEDVKLCKSIRSTLDYLAAQK